MRLMSTVKPIIRGLNTVLNYHFHQMFNHKNLLNSPKSTFKYFYSSIKPVRTHCNISKKNNNNNKLCIWKAHFYLFRFVLIFFHLHLAMIWYSERGKKNSFQTDVSVGSITIVCSAVQRNVVIDCCTLIQVWLQHTASLKLYSKLYLCFQA